MRFPNVFHIFGLILTLFILLSILFLLFILFKLPINNNVYEKISNLPFYLVIFAIFFAPISEEFFFRGLITNKLGILISSLVFALAHFSYDSLYETSAAFLIGLVFAIYFKKYKNLTPLIITHLLFNLFSFSIMLLVGK